MGNYSFLEFATRWLLCVLAVYRFAHVIAFELGPNAIFEKIRKYLLASKGEGNLMLEFIRCPLCTSFWISLAFTFLFFPNVIFPKISILDFFVIWWSVSGAVLVLHTWLYK